MSESERIAWLKAVGPTEAVCKQLLQPGELERHLVLPSLGNASGFIEALETFVKSLRQNREGWCGAIMGCLPTSAFATDEEATPEARAVRERLLLRLEEAIAAATPLTVTETELVPSVAKKPVVVKKSASVRVVLVRADQTTMGILGTLTLRWLAGDKPLEWVRHPDWAITALNHQAKTALTNALAWATSIYDTTATGTVEWNLKLQATHPIWCLSGESWGLPLGIGLAMLLDPQTVPEDSGIVPTGALHRDGSLHLVTGYIAKEEAAFGLDSGCYLFLCDAEGTSSAPPKRVCVAKMDEALKLYRDGGEKRKAVCESARAKESELPLLLPSQGTMEDMYAELRLMKEEKRVEVRTRDGEDKERSRPVGPQWEREGPTEYTLSQGLSYGVPQNLDGILEKLAPGVCLTLIGPPGSGKSTLVQHLSYRAAKGDLPGTVAGRLPGLVRLNSIKSNPELKELRRFNSGLELLTAFLHDRYPGADESHWRSWLQQGQVLLTLDGVDEVQNDTALLALLKDALPHLPGPKVVTCRVISRTALRGLGLAIETDQNHSLQDQQQPIYQLAVLDDEARRQFVVSYCRTIHVNEYRKRCEREGKGEPSEDDIAEQIKIADEIAAQLNKELHEGRSPGGVLGNPMMLSLVCYFRIHTPDTALPETRTGLYTAVLDHYLKDIAPEVGTVVTTALRLHDPVQYRRMLEAFALRLAWQRTGEDGEELTATYEKALEIFQEAVVLSDANDRKQYATSLAEDGRICMRLLSYSGSRISDRIPVGQERTEGKFAFLHLTFQEYFAACSMADVLVKVPPSVILDAQTLQIQPTYAEMLSDLAFIPWWSEVFVFLTGRLRELAETAPDAATAEHRYNLMLALLDLLDDPDRDDLLHHHLALAADCMVEANDERLWNGEWAF